MNPPPTPPRRGAARYGQFPSWEGLGVGPEVQRAIWNRRTLTLALSLSERERGNQVSGQLERSGHPKMLYAANAQQNIHAREVGFLTRQLSDVSIP